GGRFTGAQRIRRLDQINLTDIVNHLAAERGEQPGYPDAVSLRRVAILDIKLGSMREAQGFSRSRETTFLDFAFEFFRKSASSREVSRLRRDLNVSSAERGAREIVGVALALAWRDELERHRLASMTAARSASVSMKARPGRGGLIPASSMRRLAVRIDTPPRRSATSVIGIKRSAIKKFPQI